MHTTLAKAKEFRRHIEPLITLAKVDSVHHRRLAFYKFQDFSDSKNPVNGLVAFADSLVSPRPIS